MRVIYDRHTDTLSIILNDGVVSESDEEKPGLIFDYDATGGIVSLEILDASQRVSHPTEMVYQLAGD